MPSHKRLTFREEYMMKLELESITKFYGKYPALQNVSATLTEGVYGLLGPNGAGKTTLINILIGILPASSGVIHLDGENTVQMGGRYFDRIGYMPQYPQFYANFTVQEFLDYMCQVKGVANAKESIDAALVFVNLEENRSKRIGALSGGMRQRLGIAQAILNDPKLLVLDEPTNHLDIYMRESLTQALAAYTGTLLLVTHDRYLMQTLGCPIMYLEDGKATFYPSFAALQNRDAGKTQEQQKTEDTAKKQAYGKEQRKRRAEVRARLKKVESEIEEHIVELENEINDPEVLRDHLLLRDKCDELDDTRFHQQELYDEWEKLAEEQETFENEGE